MAAIAQNYREQITPAPTPLVFERNVGSSSKKVLSYPGCAMDATGPCEMFGKLRSDCSTEFPSPSFNHYFYCMCTNGYYKRSSECFFDCYTKTDFDPVAESRKNQAQSFSCKMNSLNMLNDEARWASTSAGGRKSLAIGGSDEDPFPTMTGDPGNSEGGIPTGLGGLGGNTVGTGGASLGPESTDAVVPPETVSWAERPTVTAPSQSSADMTSGVTLHSVTVVLALVFAFYGL